MDLGLAGVARASCMLPSPEGNASLAQRPLRTQVRGPGTGRTYVAVLKAMAPKVTARLGAAALPMTSVSPRCVFFARVLLVGPHGRQRY